MAFQYRLSEQDVELIALLCGGATRNEDLAECLHRDVETVRARLKQIYGKTRARDRLNLLLWAREQGIGGGFGGWDDGIEELDSESDFSEQGKFFRCS